MLIFNLLSKANVLAHFDRAFDSTHRNLPVMLFTRFVEEHQRPVCLSTGVTESGDALTVIQTKDRPDELVFLLDVTGFKFEPLTVDALSRELVFGVEAGICSMSKIVDTGNEILFKQIVGILRKQLRKYYEPEEEIEFGNLVEYELVRLMYYPDMLRITMRIAGLEKKVLEYRIKQR